MALPISLDSPAVPLSSRATSLFVSLRRSHARTSLHHFRQTLRAQPIRSTIRTTKFPIVNAVQESQENTESEAAISQPGPPDEPNSVNPPADSSANLGAEIKEALKQRKEEKGDLLSGVADEIREIEWPVFRKVLGTTGVVLSVIAGSSVVLLTVNAILAELSDRVFTGKGVQDFFS